MSKCRNFAKCGQTGSESLQFFYSILAAVYCRSQEIVTVVWTSLCLIKGNTFQWVGVQIMSIYKIKDKLCYLTFLLFANNKSVFDKNDISKAKSWLGLLTDKKHGFSSNKLCNMRTSFDDNDPPPFSLSLNL